MAGHFIADFLIEALIIVELKPVSRLPKIHETQLVDYLILARGINGRRWHEHLLPSRS